MRRPAGCCNGALLPRRCGGVKPGISMPGRLIAALWIAAALFTPAARAAEPAFVPIPAYSPEAEAVREAAALRRKGDQLQEQAPAEKVREVWQAAVEAYRRAGYQLGEVELLFQIAATYQSEIMNGPEPVIAMFDAMVQGATITAGFLDGLARLAGVGVPAPDPEADALLDQGLDLAEAGDCARALPLLATATKKHAEKGAGTGELRALAGRLRCQQTKGEDPMSLFGFMGTLQEFMRIAQGLQGKLKAGPAVRYLRAVESAKLGKLEESERLLREVLPELEAAGDGAAAGRAALDLGCVLLREGRPEEAEPFLRQARDVFAGLQDPASRRNQRAAEKNLAGLGSPVARVPEDKLVSDLPEPEVVPMPQPPPEPAGLSARARARREAAFLMGEGDRLERAGRRAAAREKWQAAAEAYRRGEELWDLSQVYFRLSGSYGSWSVSDEKKRWLFLDYFDEGLSAFAEAYGGSVQKELPIVEEELAQADDLLRQAARLIESGDCRQALRLLPEARRHYRRAGLALGEARSLVRQARCTARSRDFLGTTGIFLEVFPILMALPMGSPTSELKIQAAELFELGRWRESRYAYQDLLCRSERDRDVRSIALALLGLGRVEEALKNPSEAEVLIERALGLLPLVDEEFDENREASAFEDLGEVYFSMGRLDEGIAALRRAQQVFERAGLPEREVKSLRRLSTGFLVNGEYAEALATLEEAADLQRFLPRDAEVEGDLVILKAWIRFQQGKFQDTLAGLFEAQDLYSQTGSIRKQAGVLFLMGGIQSFLGRQEEAVTLYKQAGDLNGRSAGAVLPRLEKFGELVALIQLDEFQHASELGRDLLASVDGGGDDPTEAMARVVLAMSYLGSERMEEARVELDAITRLLAERQRSPGGLEESLAIFVGTFLQTVESIYTLLEEARKHPDMVANHPVAVALLKGLAEGLGKHVEVLKGPGETIVPNAELIPQVFSFLERLASQDARGSLAEMDEVLALVDRWTDGVPLGELKASVISQIVHYYSEAVSLSWTTGLPEEAFRYAEEARARAFADQIGNQKIDARQGADSRLLREERRIRLQLNKLRNDLRDEQRKSLAEQSPERLENLETALKRTEQEWEDLMLRLKVTNPESAMLLSVDPVSLEELRTQVLDGETSLVEYFVSEGVGEGVFAWVVERERFEMVQLPVSSGDLRKRVAELRGLIEARKPIRPQAEDLYRLLFVPLASHVAHRRLVIVPHGVLHFLPFAALWDVERRGFLGDLYALSHAPSATVLKFVRQRQVLPQEPILIAGNPDGSLPNATKEAQAIAGLYQTESLLKSAATESAIVSLASEAGILHLAAHAELNPINPLFTAILLAPGGDYDGRLEMHEVYGLDLSKTALVVLSACNTQMGKLSQGDEIEGLTRAFLYAGTPAVISSLWKVESESTAFLMERFYTHLRKGQGRAEALRNAQAETRRRFPHPYHWAAFVLTGDGR